MCTVDPFYYRVCSEGVGLLGSLDLLPAKKKAVVDRLLSGVSDIQRLERSRINELGDLLGTLNFASFRCDIIMSLGVVRGPKGVRCAVIDH